MKPAHSRISNFLKGPDFFKGLVLATAIVLPISVAYQWENSMLGLSMAMGVLLSSASDVQGNFRHKVVGIVVSAGMAAIVTVLMNWAIGTPLLIPVMCLLVFGISYISIYGFRASLTTFAGLLAIALSLAHPQAGTSLYIHALLILAGGLWYLALSVILVNILPLKHTELLLSDTIRLTAKYIRTQSTYLADKEIKDSNSKLLNLQQQINEQHETLRELLIRSRRNRGYSNLDRRHLLIFIELVDILEIAVANTINYKQVAGKLKDYPKCSSQLLKGCNEVADHLEVLSQSVARNHKTPDTQPLHQTLKNIELTIKDYVAHTGLPQAREGALLLHNLKDELEAMVRKLEAIQRTVQKVFDKNQIRKLRDSEKFITQQDYSPKLLIENFGLQSPIFRHALRLTITVLVAYAVGTFFKIQNTYWIILTVMVIMRPNYGLTRQRSRHRIIGTFIGALIAIAIVLLTPNRIVYGVLSVISLVFAFSFIQKNYKTSAIFITLNIVLAYALLEPNALEVIQYRVLDTVTGVVLAMAANQFLLPAWEYKGVSTFIAKSIEANFKFLQEIADYYYKKGQTPPSYKLSRKRAFLAIGQLNAAFQRMAQDPPSRQKNIEHVYEAVTLNHTFLIALTSLGTYMRQHHTLSPSPEFKKIISLIQNNLEAATACLQGNSSTKPSVKNDAARILGNYEDQYKKLSARRNKQIEEGQTKLDPVMRSQLQESRLMADQLQWLFNLSVNLSRICSQLNAEEQLSASDQIN